MDQAQFKKTVWNYYRNHGRDFPWRRTKDPYKILVSEIMLQQTQAPRIIEKYELFLATFPSFVSLANASVRDVYTVWKGLGYNRRALALKKTAEIVIKEKNGKLPKNFETLVELPGIGPATAGDILAFAWNIPHPLIETNIRAVYIHFFFNDQAAISDKEIMPLIESTLDTKNPREWYYALMDYGAMLKTTLANPSRKSTHYKKQSAFKGSDRQLRGKILLILSERGTMTSALLRKHTGEKSARVQHLLKALKKEGFIIERGKRWSIV